MPGTVADNLDDFTRASFPDSVLTPKGQAFMREPVPPGVDSDHVSRLANQILPNLTLGAAASKANQPISGQQALNNEYQMYPQPVRAVLYGLSGASKAAPSLNMTRDDSAGGAPYPEPGNALDSAADIAGQFGMLGLEGLALGTGVGVAAAPAGAAFEAAASTAAAGGLPLALQRGSVGQRTGRGVAGAVGSLFAGQLGRKFGDIAGNWLDQLGAHPAITSTARVTAGQAIGAGIAAGPQTVAEHTISDEMDQREPQHITWHDIGRNFVTNLIAGHLFHFGTEAAKAAAGTTGEGQTRPGAPGTTPAAPPPSAAPGTAIEAPQTSMATPLQKLPFGSPLSTEHVKAIAQAAQTPAPGSQSFPADKPYAALGGMTQQEAYNATHAALTQSGQPDPAGQAAGVVSSAAAVEDNLQPKNPITTTDAARQSQQLTEALQRLLSGRSDGPVLLGNGTRIENAHLAPAAARVYPGDPEPIRMTAVDNQTGRIYPLSFKDADAMTDAVSIQKPPSPADFPNAPPPEPETATPEPEAAGIGGAHLASGMDYSPEIGAPKGRTRLPGMSFASKEEAQNVAEVIAHQSPHTEPNVMPLPGNKWTINVKSDAPELRQGTEPPKPATEIPVVEGARRPSDLRAARYDPITGRYSVHSNATEAEIKEGLKWVREQLKRTRSPMGKAKLQRFAQKLRERLASESPEHASKLSSEMIDRVNASVRQMVRSRGLQEEGYTRARGERIAHAREVARRTSGVEGLRAELRQLSGPLPKVMFTPMEGFNKEETDQLLEAIKHSPKLNDFEKYPARLALLNMMGKDAEGHSGLGGKLPTDSELRLLQHVFGDDFVNSVLNVRDAESPSAAAARFLINLPKTMQLLGHLTAPMRQGKVAMTMFPKEWAGATPEMYHFFGSQEYFDESMKQMEEDPEFNHYIKSGGLWNELETEPAKLTTADIAGSAAEKLPVFGGLKQASDRAYIGYLNMLRFNIWKVAMATARSRGVDPESPSRGINPYIRGKGTPYARVSTIAEDAAHFTNHLTGGGDVPEFVRSGRGILSQLFGFYGPRLLSSDASWFNVRDYAALDPAVRRQKLNAALNFAAANALFLAGAHALGAKVDLDPRKPNFGGITFGTHHWNLAEGISRVAQLGLLTAMWGAHAVRSMNSEKPEKSPFPYRKTLFDYASRFWQSKLNPTGGELVALAQGKNFQGEPMNVRTITKDLFVPLVTNDIVDYYTEAKNDQIGQIPSTILGGVGIVHGAAIHSYENTPPQRGKGLGRRLPGMASPGFHPRTSLNSPRTR